MDAVSLASHRPAARFAPRRPAPSLDRERLLTEYLRGTRVLPAGMMRSQRTPIIARGLALCGASMSGSDLILLADLVLAIYAVDDLADEGALSVEEVELRLAQLAGAAAGVSCPELTFDPLARCLLSIAARLRRAPHGQALWPVYRRSMDALFSGMAAERRAGAALAAGVAPTLAEHLAVGEETVGVKQVALAAWMLLGEPAAVAALPLLERAASHLSLAARLSNELHSQAREAEEGKVNALGLLGPGGDALLRGRLRFELRNGREALRRCPLGAARSAAYLERFASFFIAVELDKGRAR